MIVFCTELGYTLCVNGILFWVEIMAASARYMVRHLSTLCAICVVSCGAIVKEQQAERQPTETYIFRVKPKPAKALPVAGYETGAFKDIPEDLRCGKLEGFVAAFHREYLDGTSLKDAAGTCVASQVDGLRSYRLPVAITRGADSISLVAKVYYSPSGQVLAAVDSVHEGRQLAWDPETAPYILHVNMSHFAISVANWVTSN